MAPPVVPFDLATASETLFVMAAVDAVDLPVVAGAAQVEDPSTSVDDALDLPEIVHSRA